MDRLPPESLSGARVLVVEDAFLVAEALSRQLRREGAHVLGPVGALVAATDMLVEMEVTGLPDLALLDVDIAGEPITAFARLLLARGVPMIFLTGFASSGLPDEFERCPRVRKPFGIAEVVEVMTAMRAQSNSVDVPMPLDITGVQQGRGG